jgi:hypothetical protein
MWPLIETTHSQFYSFTGQGGRLPIPAPLIVCN